jgi:hypothetical protein
MEYTVIYNLKVSEEGGVKELTSSYPPKAPSSEFPVDCESEKISGLGLMHQVNIFFTKSTISGSIQTSQALKFK